MSDVLLMPALQISHPIEVSVLMKINDLSWYPRRSCLRGLHMAATSSCVGETGLYPSCRRARFAFVPLRPVVLDLGV